jgi:hypothetical protein
VGFIKRKSKINAQMFMDTLLFKVFDNGSMSLNDHSVDLYMNHCVEIRKQSLHDRFNEASVKFVRSVLEENLKNQISAAIETKALSHFSSVKLKDSTRFQIPDDLKEDYPGCGGSASQAGVHIQFEFDLLNGKVSDLRLTDALCQDQTDAKNTVEQIEKGSLLLRDLGYFSIEALKQIEYREAYYISRINHTTKIFYKKENRYCELDIKKIHRKMKRNKLLSQEFDVYIGNKEKMPVRLLIERLPQADVNKRIAKAARKKGQTLSEEYKASAALNMFVTNAPKEKLPLDQIRTLYRLRWQIELRFKAWKSVCKLHTIKKMNCQRFETYLYASLLFIMINWEIATNLFSVAWLHTSKALSIMKCYKAIVQTSVQLREALLNPKEKLRNYLKCLNEVSTLFLLLERRKNHLSQEEILLLNLENTAAI